MVVVGKDEDIFAHAELLGIQDSKQGLLKYIKDYFSKGQKMDFNEETVLIHVLLFKI